MSLRQVEWCWGRQTLLNPSQAPFEGTSVFKLEGSCFFLSFLFEENYNIKTCHAQGHQLHTCWKNHVLIWPLCAFLHSFHVNEGTIQHKSIKLVRKHNFCLNTIQRHIWSDNKKQLSLMCTPTHTLKLISIQGDPNCVLPVNTDTY